MTTPDAAWLAVARDLCRRITSGEIPVGAKIPSREQLRQHYGVAESTNRRALQHLRAVGVLHGEQGIGVFVQRLPTPADLETRLTTEQRVTELESEVARLQARIDALESSADPELRDRLGRMEAEIADIKAVGRSPRQSGTARRRASG
jgi:DNA-binding GntR family transcriptional regulator